MPPVLCLAWLSLSVPSSPLDIDEGTESQRVTDEDHFEAYRPNYFLFGDNEDQVLFQFSVRYNLWPNDSDWDYFLAYSQRSFWRLYAWDESAPITENNFSPELFTRYRRFRHKLRSGFDQTQIGYQHESNGQDEDRSRGWERLYVEQRYTHYLGPAANSAPRIRAYLRLWWIFATDPLNDNIDEFAGPGELIVDISSGDTRGGRFYGEVVARKGGYNFRFDEGSVQLGMRWFPPWPSWVQLTPGLYAQGFFGNLQSLERYDVRDDAIRVGIVLEN